MAKSPSHKFGQVIGNLLEEILEPTLQEFCNERGLYLDTQGARGEARVGRKVTWEDKYGNVHDLDFVIEKGGTRDQRGMPLAFIEAAWRRYTKHSRNKAQEIQGAILPVAEKFKWNAPFIGAALAGVFTEQSVQQMRSTGFKTMLFPYETICNAFSKIGLDVRFNEETPDSLFQRTVEKIENLNDKERTVVKRELIELNRKELFEFVEELRRVLDRKIEKIVVVPLHGDAAEFATIQTAQEFFDAYDAESNVGQFRKFEVIVQYSNGDKIDAEFQDKERAKEFLAYIDTTQA